MRELMEWLLQQVDNVKYGTISIEITMHQGKMVSAEKHVTIKEKYSLTDEKK